MHTAISRISEYMKLYKYLPVLDGQQIWKLRKIATGILDISAFTEEEIMLLETKIMIQQEG